MCLMRSVLNDGDAELGCRGHRLLAKRSLGAYPEQAGWRVQGRKTS